jgi:hypothetical protein
MKVISKLPMLPDEDGANLTCTRNYIDGSVPLFTFVDAWGQIVFQCATSVASPEGFPKDFARLPQRLFT